MDKFTVAVEFTIKAETRNKAWQKADEVCREHLRDLATVTAVSQALSDPQDWLAVNEPIRSRS